jgi:AbrB family looped-hinge helix DNA binding protein
MAVSAEQMDSLTKSLPTKSAKIRRLAEAGVARADIARFLNLRYQHVRNVLVAAEHNPGREEAAKPADTTDEQSGRVRIGPQGRIQIPAATIAKLGLKEGQTLFVEVESGEIHLLPVAAAVSRAQAIIRKFVPAEVSLVDQLLEDRRREVEREHNNG